MAARCAAMRMSTVSHAEVHLLVDELFATELHVKRVKSLSNATVGVIESGTLAIRKIGHGLALAHQLKWKHAIKQVDRLIGNPAVDPWELASKWVPFVIGNRTEVVVALDWTDFDADGQSTIALSLVTGHGRASPLLWKTVGKKQLAKRRNEFEDDVLQRLKDTIPATVSKVTVLADRGFGDSKLYEALKEQWGFNFVIRFRGVVKVTDENGETRPAKDWVAPNGRARLLRNAMVTGNEVPVPGVVLVKAKGMKEPWCLAIGDGTLSAADAVALYSKRFTIEESFRDIKDLRFGMGLSMTRVSTPERRDRLLLVSALAISLLTLLGEAGEAADLERHYKANTVKTRSFSLFRQGCMYYESLPGMRAEWAEPLIANFVALLRQQPVFRELFVQE